jgi:hypothetical protein
MTNERDDITTREEQVEIPPQWPEKVDLPTIHANRLSISHAGREFFLLFGKVTPGWPESTPEWLQKLESVEIKPVAKIAISSEAMPAIVKAIREMEGSRRLHKAIKERMRQRNPSLKTQLPREEIVQLMDKLSKKMVESPPFATWQEAMAFIRGKDHHDFERQ